MYHQHPPTTGSNTIKRHTKSQGLQEQLKYSTSSFTALSAARPHKASEGHGMKPELTLDSRNRWTSICKKCAAHWMHQEVVPKCIVARCPPFERGFAFLSEWGCRFLVGVAWETPHTRRDGRAGQVPWGSLAGAGTGRGPRDSLDLRTRRAHRNEAFWTLGGSALAQKRCVREATSPPQQLRFFWGATEPPAFLGLK